MLASINPLGERGRNRTWWVTYSWYVAGSLAGAALLGTLLGALGAGFDALVPRSDAATAAAVLVVSAVALVFELGLGGLALPTIRRQVDENWIRRYRAWVYAGGFGFQLGLGVVTVVPTATVYLTWVLAFLSGSVGRGFVIGVAFGVARTIPMLLVRHADTPDRLRSVLRRFDAAAPAARRVATTTAACVPLVAAAFVAGSSR